MVIALNIFMDYKYSEMDEIKNEGEL